jgi:hypothetical protein
MGDAGADNKSIVRILYSKHPQGQHGVYSSDYSSSHKCGKSDVRESRMTKCKYQQLGSNVGLGCSLYT